MLRESRIRLDLRDASSQWYNTGSGSICELPHLAVDTAPSGLFFNYHRQLAQFALVSQQARLAPTAPLAQPAQQGQQAQLAKLEKLKFAQC